MAVPSIHVKDYRLEMSSMRVHTGKARNHGIVNLVHHGHEMESMMYTVSSVRKGLEGKRHVYN